MNVTPEYIAGFLDGEGCIQIVKQRSQGHHSWTYRLVVAVTNTYEPIVRALHDRYGGVLGSRLPKSSRKTCYYWHATGERARAVLEEIGPLLIEKRPQAEMALQYLAARTNSKTPATRVTEEELALREGYYLALREAKR